MKTSLLLAHARDILLLPFTVLVIVPHLIYDNDQPMTADSILLTIIGTMLIIPGITLFAYSIILFNNIAKGTLAPWSPKQKLVVEGPYRYCRNPMITGVL